MEQLNCEPFPDAKQQLISYRSPDVKKLRCLEISGFYSFRARRGFWERKFPQNPLTLVCRFLIGSHLVLTSFDYAVSLTTVHSLLNGFAEW